MFLALEIETREVLQKSVPLSHSPVEVLLKHWPQCSTRGVTDGLEEESSCSKRQTSSHL